LSCSPSEYDGEEPDKEVEIMGGTRPTVSFAAVLLVLALTPVILAQEGAVDDAAAQEETVTSLRELGTGVMAYSMDHSAYPGPTEGWVEVGSIKDVFEGMYLRNTPTADGWGHAILFWSDGEQNYALVSPGRDGEVEQDWIKPATDPESERRATTDPDADIVYSNERFVSIPENPSQPAGGEDVKPAGREDSAEGPYRVELDVDRTALELPQAVTRRGIPRLAAVISLGTQGVLRVSTGTEMSLPVATDEEVRLFIAGVAADAPELIGKPGPAAPAVSCEPDPGAPVLIVAGQQVFTADEPIGLDPPPDPSTIAGFEEASSVQVFLEPSASLYGGLVNALDLIGRIDGGPDKVSLCTPNGDGLHLRVVGASEPPPPATVVLKIDRSVPSERVEELLRWLHESRIGSATLLTELRDTGQKATYPGALPGGIELRLAPAGR
jgi:hypothetical protein